MPWGHETLSGLLYWKDFAISEDYCFRHDPVIKPIISTFNWRPFKGLLIALKRKKELRLLTRQITDGLNSEKKNRIIRIFVLQLKDHLVACLLTEDVFVEEDFTLDWLLDEVMVEGGEGGVHDEGDQEEKQRK